MFFANPEFLLFFVPIAAACFYFFNNKNWRLSVLVCASILFYASGKIDFKSFNIEQLTVLVADIAWVYCITRPAGFVGNRRMLFLAIVFPLGLLAYFKYCLFMYGIACHIMPVCKAGFRYVPSVPPPAGISFFTFQLVAFTIDRFRGTIPAMPNPLEFSLFISFFPHILSGPLSRFAAFQAQLKKMMQALPWNNIKAAVPFIVIGLAYKVIVADTLALILEPMTSRPEKLGILSCSYVFFANSYKLYFDFLGYSLTAIGLGKIFGIRLPANFDLPYLAKNPRDFWRRWHITLSLWIRDYIYLPLGGKQQYARNILITFFLCGLWHGAGWNYIVWGLFHAGIILLYTLTKNRWDAIPVSAQVTITFMLVSAGWLLFAFDIDALMLYFKSMTKPFAADSSMPSCLEWFCLPVCLILSLFKNPLSPVEKYLRKEKVLVIRGILLAVLFFTVLLFQNRAQTFIYTRF